MKTGNSNATSDTREETRERTGRAIVAADEAYLRDSIESVRWEERGFLRRLVRVDHSPRGGAEE
jgi:hypothetical protein